MTSSIEVNLKKKKKWSFSKNISLLDDLVNRFLVNFIRVRRSFELPFYRLPPIWPTSPHFLNIFSKHPNFDIFWKYYPNEKRDKNKNKLRTETYFMLRKIENNFTCFSSQLDFHEQHQDKIRIKIITMLGIKRNLSTQDCLHCYNMIPS